MERALTAEEVAEAARCMEAGRQASKAEAVHWDRVVERQRVYIRLFARAEVALHQQGRVEAAAVHMREATEAVRIAVAPAVSKECELTNAERALEACRLLLEFACPGRRDSDLAE